MSKSTTNSRRQRREYLKRAGMLKQKNMYSPLSKERQAWYNQTHEDGVQRHEAHVKKINDSIEEQLQTSLNNAKETWRELGYDEFEISKLEEAYTLLAVKLGDSVREDKKEARRLMMEARISKQKRISQ